MRENNSGPSNRGGGGGFSLNTSWYKEFDILKTIIHNKIEKGKR